MPDLESLWREAFGRYDALKAACEGQAVRWEWTSGQRCDPRPYFFERTHTRRGKVLDAEPADKNFCWHCGFDAADRMAVARSYTRYPDPQQSPLSMAISGVRLVDLYDETFYTYRTDGVDGVHYWFFTPKLPIEVTTQEIAGGQLRAWRSFAVSLGPQIRVHTPQAILDLARRTQGLSTREEDYFYEGPRLSRIAVRGSGYGAPAWTWDEHLAYDARGRLVAVEARSPDGTTRPVYHRAPRGESFSALGERVRRRLVEVIPPTLAAAGIHEPVYSLVLNTLDQYVPPALILGLESYRAALLADPGPDARHWLWYPVDPSFAVDDPDFADTYALYEQQVNMGEKWEQARRLLRHVAADLTQGDWSGRLPVTPDFVVYAMDYELDDLHDALAASVPAARLAEFRAKGWL